ncbi:hypothetical protein IE981_27745 [Klebsiella pneumoniae]|nr:hypothetical protein [Klebsiella pneumoniae]
MVEGSGCEKENMIGYSSIHNNLKAMCGKYFIDYYLTNKNVDVNKMKIQKSQLIKVDFLRTKSFADF